VENTNVMNPSGKYQPFPPVPLSFRSWPSRTITHAPIWLSTDLRDGNQALFDPLDTARKNHFFDLLLAVGFKEIEVAFPSASQMEFDFVRGLIEGAKVPDDVTLSVLTQAREHLIRRTVESLRGARQAIVHMYVSTAPNFRQTVFGLSRREVLEMAVSGVRQIRDLTDSAPETAWRLEFTPENFSGTELEFSLEVCEAVLDTWNATPDRQVILNLPATVELATPNVYADQIEWMHTHLSRREAVILSVHPHNDRGTGVAAAELAMLAGAERVEGCLFGNGERTGNLDLAIIALNLFTQGIDPGLDLSDIGRLSRDVEDFTGLPLSPRHPYAGDLVFTAFSGSHQDAIRKGLAARTAQDSTVWDIPYLPVDPEDIGRSYDSIIRVNSQSGKGGVAYLLETAKGLFMPRRLQIEFGGIVQRQTEAGGEIGAEELWQLFDREYLDCSSFIQLEKYSTTDDDATLTMALRVGIGGHHLILDGAGNGPIDATLKALGFPVTLHSYEERAIGKGADAKASAFVELSMTGVVGTTFGVGIHDSIVTASVRAVLSGINRLLAKADIDTQSRMMKHLAA